MWVGEGGGTWQLNVLDRLHWPIDDDPSYRHEMDGYLIVNSLGGIRIARPSSCTIPVNTLLSLIWDPGRLKFGGAGTSIFGAWFDLGGQNHKSCCGRILN